jgi:hypothetical protein
MGKPINILQRRVKDITARVMRQPLRIPSQIDVVSNPLIPSIASVTSDAAGTDIIPGVSKFIRVIVVGTLLQKVSNLVFQDNVEVFLPSEHWALTNLAVAADGSEAGFDVEYPISWEMLPAPRLVGMYSACYSSAPTVLIYPPFVEIAEITP